MTAELHRSRTAASARLLGTSGAEHRFLEKSVLLTGELDALATPNGREMARVALQLLMRICPNIYVALPPVLGPLASDLAADGRCFAWDAEPQFVPYERGCWPEVNAVLSIGGGMRPELPWTAITASGWLVRVASLATPISSDCSRENPICAMGAASFGVAEVFKRLIELDPEWGDLLDATEFSLWDYSISGDPGPDIPPELSCNLMLNGAGAIGSGLVHGLARLPITGPIVIVDKQSYAVENWGTCLDLERAQIGETNPKAEIAARRLKHVGDVHAFQSTIDEVHEKKLGGAIPWPTVILNGLDDIDARHDAQNIWPDIVIDGALDSDLQVRVSAHRWEGGQACLICTYQHPPGRSARGEQMRVTGLSAASLVDLDRELTDEDIEAAEPSARQFLRERKGRTICSIVREEMAKSMSGGKSDDGFAPSVPFAATLSAAMLLTELVRYLTTASSALSPIYQISMLFGPQTAQLISDRRHADCICARNRHLIDRVRAERSTRPGTRTAA